jgi:hypothetical protein
MLLKKNYKNKYLLGWNPTAEDDEKQIDELEEFLKNQKLEMD